ncbi:Brp/Blh family beta-carotene 15,15'-dioxygenase [Mycobacterium antarcticum]|uniref:Brp/Blh family beta-carotene 15,15'-dioxygenase n=1 Tax=unclassified Mycolicibacterium TaxID=2636767 RepID=UPI0024E0A51E|nr:MULTISPECIES: Brp/Blh family beta-carotene 15,15'-dioxygenase [unclassified Mycolicibacterium]
MSTISLGAVAAAVGWAVLDPTGLTAVAPIVAAVGIVLGVPHGAMDHLVPGLASPRWQAPTQLALIAGVYVTIAAAACVAVLRAPDLGFAIFLVVSALHFGWAETTYAAERSGHSVPRLRDGWWDAVAHGSVVVVLPLWSAEGRSAMRPLLPHLVDWVSTVPTQWATGAVVLMSTVSALHLASRRRFLEAVESIAVLTLFLTVPVFAAFGVYFGLWHALRHTTRLMDTLASGQPIRLQVRAFVRAAALPTAAALAVLGVLFAYRSDVGVVMTGVSVLLALTLPHVVVVALLDHHRRIAPRGSTASTA